MGGYIPANAVCSVRVIAQGESVAERDTPSILGDIGKVVGRWIPWVLVSPCHKRSKARDLTV